MATTINSGYANSPKLTANIADHADVYGGRALVFDGVVDSLNLNAGNGLISRADIEANGESFSAWIKLDNVSGLKYVVGHGRNVTDNDTIYGGIYIQDTTAKFILYKNSAYQIISGTTTLSADTWYHIVGTYDGENNDDKTRIYINGSLEATSSALGGNFITAEPTIAYIGRNTNGLTPDYFNGSISDVKIYSSALTEAEVQSQYLKPESVPSPSTLVAWYPMIEGNPESPQSIVYDYSEKGLGSELVTNGTFDSNLDNWFAYVSGRGTTSWSSGRIKIDNTTGTGNYYLQQYQNLYAGKVYKISIDVFAIQGTETSLRFFFSNNQIHILNTSEYKSGDTYTAYLIPTADVASFMIGGSGLPDIYELDNISIKEVLQSEVSDTYPAIIDVNEPVLGGEEISEPSFASSTGWTLGTGWSISSNTLSSDGSQSASSNASALITTSAGYYRVVITVDSISSGTIRPNLESWGSYISTTGTSTQFFTLTGNNNLTIQASADFVGSISFASVKEVFGNVGKMTNQDSADLVYSSVLPDQSFLTGVNSAYNFLDFDGTDAYVDIGSSINDALAGSSTISFWTKVDLGTGSQQFFVGAYNSSVTNLFFFTKLTDGKIQIVYEANNNRGTADTDNAIFVSGQNDWKHIVGVIDDTSNQINIYVNGDLQTLDSTNDGDISNVTNSDFDLDINLLIGARNQFGTPTRFFNGSINQFAIWNKALSSSEVSAIYKAGRHTNLLDSYSDNLKGYYAFGALDSKTGLADTDSTIYDRSGNSNHGTTSGTATGDLKSPPNAEPNGYAKGDTNRSTTTP